MTGEQISDDSPGTALFPEYASLYPLIASEVEGLTGHQLDFASDRWGWAEWSIRVQLSHMDSLLYRWLVVRWGDTLFPDGNHGVDDVDGLTGSEFDRRLNDNRYWDLPAILEKLEQGVALARRVLAERNVGFLRSHTYVYDLNPQWDLMFKAHPHGVEPSDQPGKGVMRLDGAMRHMYFEEVTHLFNIQRLKRAQGLTAVAELPRVGYWTVEGWDVSEP